MTQMNGKAHAEPLDIASARELQEAAVQLMAAADNYKRLSMKHQGQKMVLWLKGQHNVVIVAMQELTEEIIRRIEGRPETGVDAHNG